MLHRGVVGRTTTTSVIKVKVRKFRLPQPRLNDAAVLSKSYGSTSGPLSNAIASGD